MNAVKPHVLQSPVGFVSGVQIKVSAGVKPVEDLQPGDCIATLSHGFRTLVSIDQKGLQGLAVNFPLIQIKAGVLGAKCDTLMTEQQIVLLSHWLVKPLFGVKQAFAQVSDLVDGIGVCRKPDSKSQFYCLGLDTEGVIVANGLPVWCSAAGNPARISPTDTADTATLAEKQTKQIVDSKVVLRPSRLIKVEQ